MSFNRTFRAPSTFRRYATLSIMPRVQGVSSTTTL